jgi:hypothetical protein
MCNALLAQMILVSNLDNWSRPNGNFHATAKANLFLDFFDVLMDIVEAMEVKSSPPAALLLRLEQVLVDHVATFEGRYPFLTHPRRSRAWKSMSIWNEWNCSLLTLSLQYNVAGIYLASPRSALFNADALRM